MNKPCDSCGIEVDGMDYEDQAGLCDACLDDPYSTDDELDDNEHCADCGDPITQAEFDTNFGVCDDCSDTVDGDEGEDE